jgi:hypothetical protein
MKCKLRKGISTEVGEMGYDMCGSRDLEGEDGVERILKRKMPLILGGMLNMPY